ncbi:shikimate dehydrogenase [Labedella gwakjiensis]|uniref:Shikimate dehydrogenase n=1 Tax=Labedella gwakjiensis TaxID=390269 RepID=A0A2P8GZS4_9MICO|nr:shikimate dehydrogenase [Labedella gwakjiensis]PSL39471.1 shikimate dehydrogenase [Labedella gwakjiensis]RUQ86127.1 shikimate dehydrogenase [Labedella gwakjiensis]
MDDDTPVPLFGVIGSPIEHSRSPILHRAAYQVIGFDAEYDRTEVVAGGLTDFLSSSPPRRRGVSITMPLKREAWVAATTRDRAAELTGAVNTLVWPESGGQAPLSGSNTDVAGIVDAVRAALPDDVRRVLVLGAGATAASAVVAAVELGAVSLTLAVRSPERAGETVGLARSLGLDVTVVALADVAAVRADLVVSTLPGGTAMPALPLAALVPGAVVLDVAYSPWPSALVERGIAERATVVHGLSMLVHQAAQQVRVFAGLDEGEWGDAVGPVTRAMFDVVGLPSSGVVTSLR